MLVEAPGAAIVVTRRLEWNETDAAGHNHFASAFRWMEEAEHELFDCLGLDRDLVDRLPRVHVEMDYSERLIFGDELTIHVAVARVGRSSCAFTFSVDTAGQARAITGEYTIVHTSSTSSGAVPWPQEVRNALVSNAAFLVSRTVQCTVGDALVS